MQKRLSLKFSGFEPLTMKFFDVSYPLYEDCFISPEEKLKEAHIGYNWKRI
jgi:hypothetical protein